MIVLGEWDTTPLYFTGLEVSFSLGTTLMCSKWNLFVASCDVKGRVGAVYLAKIIHDRYRWGTVIYYMHSSTVNLFA